MSARGRHAPALLAAAWVAACAASRPPPPPRGRAPSPAAATERAAPAADAGASCVPGADAVCLPGGLSQLGADRGEGHFEERPPRAARLGPFALDRREVTARAWSACVAAGRCPPPGCDAAPDAPVRCVSARDAEAYCAFRGGRLPTEAEWERAAAGRLPEHRAFPWGDAPDAGALEDVTPEGVLDLGGGVAEWVADGGDFYQLPPVPGDAGDAGDAPDAPERTDGGLYVVDDPRGPERSPWRVARGGDARTPVEQRATTLRRFRAAADRLGWVGVRCAYAAPR